MERPTNKTKLLRQKGRGEIRELRDDKRETVVVIPVVVGIVIVGVEPTAIIIAIRVEEFQIAIRIV